MFGTGCACLEQDVHVFETGCACLEQDVHVWNRMCMFRTGCVCLVCRMWLRCMTGTRKVGSSSLGVAKIHTAVGSLSKALNPALFHRGLPPA